MISDILVINYPTNQRPPVGLGRCDFVLNTCQRSLCITYTNHQQSHLLAGEVYKGKKAYAFLLETICGLQSRLLGESEIVSQFKDAYRSYMNKQERDGRIIKVLEKLFKDAKEVRTKYLLRLGQQSYAGISRRILQQKKRDGNVLILGSGNLARDVIIQLEKKYDLHIAARNEQRVNELQQEFQNIDLGNVLWSCHKSYQQFDAIINTVGSTETILDDGFFMLHQHESRLFLDLGSPSAIETQLGKKEGIFRLGDIFNQGTNLNEQKKERIQQAQKAIDELTHKRAVYLSKDATSFSYK